MTPAVSPVTASPPATAGGVLVPGPDGRRDTAFRRYWRAIGSPTLLAALITIAAGGALITLYRRYLLAEARQRVVVQTVPYGQALSAVLAHRMAILQGLAGFLRIEEVAGRGRNRLKPYTEDLQRGTPGIRSAQLTRDGVIIALAPLAGNEAALGFDLHSHSDPTVRARVRDAETTDRVTVTGPLELRQGGKGLILRQRFRRTLGRGYDLAGLVLDFDPLLAEAGLVDQLHVRVAIRDRSGRVLFGDSTLEQLDPVEVEVRLPNDRWRLQAVPVEGWSAAVRERLLLFVAGVLVSGVLFVLVVYLVASRQAALVGAVDERTRSLRDAVEELRRVALLRESTEAQLRQSQRLESLGRLAGGIAHDFNNLLTVILGSISLAREGVPESSESGADLRTAEQAAHRGSDLTRKLLAFARRQTVEPQVVDLNALMRDLQPIVHSLLGERVRVVEDLAPGLWQVLVDHGQLEQVVTNLVVNARDAMPNGGTLTISTRNVELGADAGTTDPIAPGEYVRLEVTDTGVGMSPEVLQRVFEPFFTTKELGQGTGLGLATVYGIVRQSGGDIALHSALGNGCRVTIHLPRATAQQPLTTTPVPGEGRSKGGGETVLLVEDETPVRRIAGRILAEAGYRVMAAEDGDSALRRLEPGMQIDLLVADVVTPGMGGRALAERILERDPATRVLFISGYIADERLEELLARPGVAFLAKPFTARQLQRVVRQLLDTAPRG